MNENNRKLRVGVIGCGRIANSAHFPALTKLDDVRIKYACDILIEKAAAAKEKFPKIENITADAGYASEENYTYLEQNGQKAYIKPADYEVRKTRKFKKDIYRV